MRGTVTLTSKPFHPSYSLASSALASFMLLASSTCSPASIASPLACSEIIVTVDAKDKGEALMQSASRPKKTTLFVTARPSILRIPYASKAVSIDPDVSFPLEVNLGGAVSDILMRTEAYEELEKILTSGSQVQVSGRLDQDGDPNTRDGEDLVGRTEVEGCRSADKEPRRAKLVLEGRGAFGKLLTQRSR
jgi:hypothetical protein